MTQQTEADEVIKNVAKRWNYEDANEYLAKYHTPKDELYEKFKEFANVWFKEFANVWVSGYEDEDLRIIFKKLKDNGILKDPKDKLIALDEAIEEFKRKRWSFDPTFWDIVSKIRAKFTGEATK